MMAYSEISGSNGICPTGWHIPTDEEWKTLEGYADSQYGIGDPIWDATGWRGFDVGINLKSTSGWVSGGNGSNIYGLTVIPGGARYANGTFDYMGFISPFWSSTENNDNDTWYRELHHGKSGVGRNFFNKNHGFSVRCIEGEPPQPWSCGDSLVDDRDNQKYATTQIGDQCWMAENLNVGNRIDGISNQIGPSVESPYVS